MYRMTATESQQVYRTAREAAELWIKSTVPAMIESRLRQVKRDLEDWTHRRNDPDMDTAMDADYRYWDTKGWVDALSRK